MKENFFSLIIYVTVDRFEKVDKAEDEELVLGVTADVHGDAVTGTSTEFSRWSDWIPVFIFSILDIVAYFGAANLDNFLIIASKTFLDHKLLIILILVTRQQRTGRCRRAYSCAVADKQRRKKSVLYRRCECVSYRSRSRPVSDV